MLRLGPCLAALALVLAAPTTLAQTLSVAADPTLREVLSVLARSFEARHAGVKVAVTAGAPGAFLDQVAQGAPLDLLASADVDTLALGAQRRLLLSDLRGAFAGDTLVLVVPASASAPVQRLSDLARPEVARIALGRPASVASARPAREAINAQRLWSSVQRKVVYVDTVSALLELVASAEADAGLVYATDAAAGAGRVRVAQTLPTSPPIRYQASVVAGSAHAELAREFVVHLRSAAAQTVLAQAGFSPP